MSSGEPSDAQKLQLVIRNAVQKTVELVISARITNHLPPTPTGGVNRWFNIESMELPAVRMQLDGWKQHMSAPLQLDLFLDSSDTPGLREAVSAQGHEPSLVLLESWLLQYDPSGALAERIVWPGFYKRFMVLLRSVVAFLRLMPAHRFASALAKQRGAPVLGYRISVAGGPADDSIALGFPASPPPRQHSFTPPDSQHGKLRISVAYRSAEQYRYWSVAQPTPMWSGPPLSGQLIPDYVPFDPNRFTPDRASTGRSPAGPASQPIGMPGVASARTSSQPSSTIGSPELSGGSCNAEVAAALARAGTSPSSGFIGRSPPSMLDPRVAASIAAAAATRTPTTTTATAASIAAASNPHAAAASTLPETPVSLPAAREQLSSRSPPAAAQSLTTAAALPAAHPPAAGVASSPNTNAAPLAAAAERARLETRRSFNLGKAAEELPFLMEEDIREPSVEADTEAVLGSFIETVQQAPSLQLFGVGREYRGGGSTSPLARSVDDFSEQLDLLRTRFEGAMGCVSCASHCAGGGLARSSADEALDRASGVASARASPPLFTAVVRSGPHSRSSTPHSLPHSLGSSPPQVQPVLLDAPSRAPPTQAAMPPVLPRFLSQPQRPALLAELRPQDGNETAQDGGIVLATGDLLSRDDGEVARDDVEAPRDVNRVAPNVSGVMRDDETARDNSDIGRFDGMLAIDASRRDDSTEELLARSPPSDDDPLFPLAMLPPEMQQR